MDINSLGAAGKYAAARPATVVSVRDKVVEAYQEILRMPV